MRIVDNAVEDGVCDGRLADHIVPLSDGQLGGDQGGFSSVALFEDFEKIEAHQSQPFVAVEIGSIVLFGQLSVGGCHSGQTERVHLLECRVCQHHKFPLLHW